MNGDQLREALRDEMLGVAAPPRPSTDAMLRTARRARNRRRAVQACAGSATAVLAVVGVVALASPGGGDRRPPAALPQAAPPPSADTSAEPMPTGPDGLPQEDRTARAGTRYDQAALLLDRLVTVVPDGYTAEKTVSTETGKETLGTHQADFTGRADGVELWSYLASVDVAKGTWKGRLLTEVHTAGNLLPSEPCALAREFWGMGGECQPVTIGDATVGVVVRPGADDRFDQWAAYRHPDGVVVFVAQGAYDRQAPASPLPFTARDLAAVAVDERLHLR
ncbi:MULTISPECIES: hypothetical protein [unclassified Micromonospora]|uniref:hypothetical protein n=1 Tax=unclassified Micromonospora TaxID=2617518 RepID=UPI0018906238|nr:MULTISPECIES: hypothetical protein [unclassified Micromonospora]MBF5028582.1 hypothetical protein [Micromonospora sp. ANENR4]WBC03627.1 hypothetical protein O7546_01230 [Micromonospora sp. WMMA1976]